MKSKFVLMMFVVAAMCCSSAFGNVFYYYDLSGTSEWSTGGNWLDATAGTWGAAPVATDDIYASDHTAWPAYITVDAPAVGNTMQLGIAAGNGGLDVQSSINMTTFLYAGVGGNGTIDLNSAFGSIDTMYLSVAHQTGNGVMNMSDGTADASVFAAIGLYAGTDGYLDMSGGVFTADQFFIGHEIDAVGNVDLSGGSIVTDNLMLGANGGTGTLNLSGTGKVVIGNKYNTAEGWKAFIDTLLGSRIFNAQANIVGDTVEITAVPEPATMLLLGLGGVLLRRKR